MSTSPYDLSLPMMSNDTLAPNESPVAPNPAELRDAKIVTLAIVGVLSLMASVIPWIISRKCIRHSEFLFSSLNVLSGGVVLGAALSHLMPDADENFKKYYGDSIDYPFMALYCGSSLLLLWVVERVILGNHSHSVHGDHDSEPDEETPIPTPKDSSDLLGLPLKPECSDDTMPRSDIQHLSHMKPFVEALVFLIALSLHSIFEGLGLGAENDAKGVYTTIVAVASHKALEAFALGLAIHRAKFATWKSILLLFLYSLATPLGGAIGMVSAESESAEIASAVLVSIAAGSFLYIALIEIIPKELEKPCSKIKSYFKLFLLVFGWGFMAFIAKFA